MNPLLDSCEARNIAFVKPSALGDIVHSLPVLHALRLRFPQAKITWVVNQTYASLLEGHRELNEVLAFDRKNGLRTFPALARELYRRKFDLVIDLQGLLRTGLMTAATRAPRRVGLQTAREGARFSYTDVLPIPLFSGGPGGSPAKRHAVDRYWVVAEALGVGHLDKCFILPISDCARSWAAQRLANAPRPWLAISPGSRWPTKRWPPEHFAAVARRAQTNFGGTAILVGSTDERGVSHAVSQAIAESKRDLSGKTTLPQLAALLSLADVVLANDSGPLHLAAALGRPVVAPYTCTEVGLHGPYGQFHHAVPTSVWCAGSYRKRCGRLECMHELTPDRLWPVLEEALFTWASRCHSA
ncbi:MAG TPA: glycosyltransferase family 9 protein [Gemmataceae bacterium]|nr:glycosyltransferase family 9 protein [Gemmataceae bacterium]